MQRRLTWCGIATCPSQVQGGLQTTWGMLLQYYMCKVMFIVVCKTVLLQCLHGKCVFLIVVSSEKGRISKCKRSVPSMSPISSSGYVQRCRKISKDNNNGNSVMEVKILAERRIQARKGCGVIRGGDRCCWKYCAADERVCGHCNEVDNSLLS